MHEYWGTVNGNWFGGPNEHYEQIKNDAYIGEGVLFNSSFLNGLTIDDAWENGVHAHRAISMPGFPNFFMLIGPNSPIGNWSLITIAEAQMGYIMQLVNLWREGKVTAIRPRADATQQFNQALQDSMRGTIWMSGCKSWYIDKHGNPAMWPWSIERFREDMKTPRLSEFDLTQTARETATEVVV